MRTLMANSIVAQMLPDGVVKGGCAIKMRFGNVATRFTTDLDTATSTDPDVYAERLAAALAKDGRDSPGASCPAIRLSPKASRRNM